MRRLTNKRSGGVNLVKDIIFFRSYGKSGAAHFEMIFSFVFFVSFVFFLFIVLKPQDVSTLSGSVVSALYDSFEEEVHTNLSRVLLRADYVNEDKDCFYIELPDRIFTYSVGGGESYVALLDETPTKSQLENSNELLNIEKPDGAWVASDKFFRVSISPEFDNDDLGSCEELLDGYDLGNILEKRVVSYAALEEMHNKYYDDYNGLRIDLRIPPVFDFAIVSEGMNDVNMEPRGGIPNSVEVQAQDYVFEVLNSTGDLRNERFILKIW